MDMRHQVCAHGRDCYYVSFACDGWGRHVCTHALPSCVLVCASVPQCIDVMGEETFTAILEGLKNPDLALEPSWNSTFRQDWLGRVAVRLTRRQWRVVGLRQRLCASVSSGSCRCVLPAQSTIDCWCSSRICASFVSRRSCTCSTRMLRASDGSVAAMPVAVDVGGVGCGVKLRFLTNCGVM